MLIGLFVNNYKTYKGTKFIPLHEENLDSLKVIVGPNGAGKSTILEALDTFFNGRNFVINSDSKKSSSWVAPLFLIEKKALDSKRKDLFEELSSSLWAFPNPNLNQYNSIREFFNFRDKLSKQYSPNEYYLIFCGTDSRQPKEFSFITFGEALISRVTDENSNKLEDEYRKHIKSYFINNYNYVYIPVETSVSDFLRLETEGMQKLMNQSILDTLGDIIKTKVQYNGNSTTLTELLNTELNKYIFKVESTIQAINPEYAYQASKTWKYISVADIREKIIETYLSKRELTRNTRKISNLSSGERRQALIDVASAFLSQNQTHGKMVILAIDEPESSLNISLCYEQFSRLQELSRNNVVILATHWYGSLPTIERGTIIHVNKRNVNPTEVTTYSCGTYLSSGMSAPDEILLKSYFDLTTSIYLSLREGHKWLFCEGPDDMNYLSYYLDLSDVKILPLGGCGNVVKLYKYLLAPVNDETKKITGKAFFLIDTDTNRVNLDERSESKAGNIKIQRLSYSLKNREVQLIPLSATENSLPFEIEDAIHPKQFFNAFVDFINGNTFQSEVLNPQSIIKSFQFDESATRSSLAGDDTILKFVDTDNLGNFSVYKKALTSILENHKYKYEISKKYVAYKKEHDLSWISRVKDFFAD